MNKKIISLLLCTLIAGSCASLFSVGAVENDEEAKYIRFVENNYIKTYYDDSGNEIDITKLNNEVDVNENALPSSYDLRDSGRVTFVKNQGSEGLCWDFASTASMESNILSQPELASKAGKNPSVNLDLSEGGNSWYIHTNINDTESPLYNDYLNDPLKGTGGGFPSAVAYGLSSGYGAYPETLMPYEQWDSGYPEALRYYSDYRLKDYNELTNDNALIKQKLMDNGAITIHYNCFTSNTYMVDGMQAYFDNGSSVDGNYGDSHVVAIVGWDDSFSKENFNPEMQPENDGAWLCKNSWGEESCSTAQGYEGFFWLSYETDSYEITQFTMQSVDEFDNIYQHQITYDQSANVSSAANVFTANSDEKLEQICFAAIGASDVNVEVYKLNDGFTSPVDGKLLSAFDVSTDFTGIHSIDCPDDIFLNSGNMFSVVINQKLQLQLNFKQDNGRDASGLSYYFGDNGEWIDVADDSIYSYAAIKAYTSNTEGADKSSLEELVKEAETVNPDEEISSEIVEELKTQLDYTQTVLNDAEATQNSVDNAYYLLNNCLTKITDFTFTINTADDYFTLYDRVENKKDRNIKKIILGADIDFDGRTIDRLYTYADFSGVFDGKGHTMSNFAINSKTYGKTGLFGYLLNAKIQNVTFSDFEVNTAGFAALIASDCVNSVIENCNVKNSKIKSDSQTSVLCISASNSVIENCNIENTRVYGNDMAGLYMLNESETSVNNCTSSNTEVYSQRVVCNDHLTVSAYSQDTEYDYVPVIKLAGDECTIESFIGKITSAKSENSSITKVADKYSVDAKNGEIYVELSYDNSEKPDYSVLGDIETRELMLTGYYGTSTDMIIPSEIFGNKVTGFWDYFVQGVSNFDEITSVTIPGTIKLIPTGTFSEMPSLEKLTLEEGVEIIDGYAFSKCINLAEINLPDSLISIGDLGFANCGNLSNIDFGNGIKVIGNNAFSDCKSLVDLVLPDSVTTIGIGAFSCCAFKSVTLGKNIEQIDDNAFGFTGMCEQDFKAVMIPDFVINGYSSTAAESYAEENGLKFVDIAVQEPETTGELFDYGVFIKGDVNLDGKVTIVDATLIKKWLVKDAELSPIQLCNAIVTDSSGTIDVTNATLIQKYIAGLIDSLDVTLWG